MTDDHARQELDRLIRAGGTNYRAISLMLGRNAAYIQQYIKRGTPARLEAQDVSVIAEYFGVDPRRLTDARMAFEPADGLLMVPKLDVHASAGHGAATGAETMVGHYGFDRRWLREISRDKPESLSIVRVQGDSMAPTLIDGDDILVDQVDGSARLRDGIYVLRLDDALLVKRLALNPASGRLSISSDNPAYPSWRDSAPGDVRVVGRVVWTGRRLG